MNVPNDDLDAMRATAARLSQLVRGAFTSGRDRQGDLLKEATRVAAELETRLDRAGAQPPTPKPASRYDVPMHLLDTPANRRYAQKLREAWEAGLEVDRERYGADIGTDGMAQAVEMILVDVEQEVYGAIGRLRE